jgi:hypothetical protein
MYTRVGGICGADANGDLNKEKVKHSVPMEKGEDKITNNPFTYVILKEEE